MMSQPVLEFFILLEIIFLSCRLESLNVTLLLIAATCLYLCTNRCVSENCREEFVHWKDLYEHRTEHCQRSFVCKVRKQLVLDQCIVATVSRLFRRKKFNFSKLCVYETNFSRIPTLFLRKVRCGVD